jgi:hypothetical protein
MANGTRTFNGPEQFYGAAEATLTDPTIHLVVVRNLMSDTALDELPVVGTDEANALMREEIPDLEKVQKLAAEYWDEHGYTDYALTPTFRFNLSRPPGYTSKPHTDNWIGLNRSMRGALSLSLGKGGSAEWEARRPKRSLAAEDGTFDVNEWNRWVSKVGRRLFPVHLPATLVQHHSDGVLMPQHPFPAGHRVQAELKRSSRLYDIYVQSAQASIEQLAS